MARICELTGKGPIKGSHIWRSGKAKKQGGIGTHITAITKRRFLPNLQRVKALLPSGEVRYVRVAATAIKKGLITKAPKRTWKKTATTGEVCKGAKQGRVLSDEGEWLRPRLIDLRSDSSTPL